MRGYNYGTPASRTFNIYGTLNNWTETTLNWNNQPSAGTFQSSKTAWAPYTWAKWDVTQAVSVAPSGGNVNLLIMDASENSATDQWSQPSAKEEGASHPTWVPYLTVCYTTAGGGGSTTVSSQPVCYNGASWVNVGTLQSTTCSNKNSGGSDQLMYDGLWNTYGLNYDLCGGVSKVYEEGMFWNVTTSASTSCTSPYMVINCTDPLAAYNSVLGACVKYINNTLVNCVTASDCPAPCNGMTASCATNSTCVYTGGCIGIPTNPSTNSLWSMIQGIWTAFWNWISSILGG